MKSHFLNLFNYDKYANHLIADTIAKAGYPFKPVQLMAHLLTAQQIWYSRCIDLPPVARALWADDNEPADISAEIIDGNHKAWISYIDTLEPADFEKIIAYKRLTGDSYTNKLADICAHVINHGTHHRAQIGQHLKLAGIENLPNTDYIAFIR